MKADLLEQHINRLTTQRYAYQKNMLKIAILRAWIKEGWPRNILFWTALHDIKDDSCAEIRDLLATHGHIVKYKDMEAFLWRGEHLLTWDLSTFTAFDEPQFQIPAQNSIYPVDNWSI